MSELDFIRRYTLIANEYYREGPPNLEGIEFIVESEDAQIDELLGIERGELDVVKIDGNVAESVEDIGWTRGPCGLNGLQVSDMWHSTLELHRLKIPISAVH